MKLLNRGAAKIMTKYGVNSATDITGFGLLGHALKMALASHVSIKIEAENVPVFSNVMELIETGFIPGAAFRNLEFAEEQCKFSNDLPYNTKMLLADAQTSGGILMTVPPEKVDEILGELKKVDYESSAVIGEVLPKDDKAVVIR
jgi:selenide,water dikinase